MRRRAGCTPRRAQRPPGGASANRFRRHAHRYKLDPPHHPRPSLPIEALFLLGLELDLEALVRGLTEVVGQGDGDRRLALLAGLGRLLERLGALLRDLQRDRRSACPPGPATVTGGILNFFAFEITAAFGAFGALPEPSATTVAFSFAHVTVTLTFLTDFDVGLPLRSQAGGLSGCQSG